MQPRCISRIFFLLATTLLWLRVSAQRCDIQNKSFASGELLRYEVIYNWGPIWLESAYTEFSVSASQLNGRPCYLFRGEGGTYPKYDWFFKVRDHFETYVDSSTFRPIRFKADIAEGSKKDKHTYIFNNALKEVYTVITRGKKPVAIDTLNIGACSVDVLTAIYYARNIDYSKCKVNDTISMSIILDGKVFPIYVRYLGKTVYESKELGKFNCIKFRPLLVEGSIFRGGEHMTVVVTDDENKIPLYVESAIVVGTVKVKLTTYKGLRHPLSSKLK